MTIHQNMRALRQIAGMTQQEVADRVGLTRQAISGYESGRTQPDLDMLVRLAEIYDTDIYDLLYGCSQEQKKLHSVRVTAAAVLCVVLALLFAASCLLLLINTFFTVQPGISVTDAVRPAVEMRFAVLRVRDLLLGIAQTVSGVGCLILAVWLTGLKRLPSPKKCLLASLAFAAGCLACTLPFGAADRVYSPADYLLAAASVLPPPLLLMLYRFVLGLVRTVRARRAGSK